MKPIHPAVRGLAGVAYVALLACALASCGRTSKSLTPASESSVTWTGTVSHLFADRSVGTKPTGCTSCHHPGTTLPDYTNYDSVYVLRTEIHDRLANPTDTMRQFTGPGEADIIVNWINAGAPK